jgi:hypothetical protein
MAKTRSGPRAKSAARTCTKQFHRDQAAARLALQAMLKKVKPGTKAPVRVYPCDVCDGWHLTSKKVSGKSPPWDRDPNWSRPSTHSPPQAARPHRRVAAATASATHPFTG